MFIRVLYRDHRAALKGICTDVDVDVDVDVEVPRPPNVPLLRGLWCLLVGRRGILRGSWGVLV